MTTQNQNAEPMTIVRGGLRRPNWITSKSKQDVVFIRDKSRSMSGQKADDASAASLDLASELAEPANKDGFYLGVVDFATNSEVVHNLTKATAMTGKIAPLSIGHFGCGLTNVTAGVEEAHSLLLRADRQDQEGVHRLRPVVIIFTDGRHNDGPDPHDAAKRLKGIADLVTVAFGSDADESLLRSLATSPQHFYRCSSGRELRSFLAAVGQTMTATMAQGRNATQALTTILQ